MRPNKSAVTLTLPIAIITCADTYCGIGAGNYCDGQVSVTADLLGRNVDQQPFCQPIIQGKKLFKDKLKEWVDSERLS